MTASLAGTSAFLTFCIPTYNRSAAVRRLVTGILSCVDPDIDVVVLDNGSPDDTLEVLGRIEDRRLRVLENGRNHGALFNMVNVLARGTGKYLVYSTDQDSVDPALIGDFKSFLGSHPEVSCGYCEFGSAAATDRIFVKGLESVLAVAYTGRHPTGYFFRNDLLKQIRLVERFSDFEVVDLFPLEFAFGELAMKGPAAIFCKPLFSPNTGPEVVAHKSSTTQGSSRNAFFAPAARLKLAVSYSRHIEQLELSVGEKSMLKARVFLKEWRVATSGFRNVMRDQRLCIHYRMQSRNVSVMEMAGISRSFVTGYFARALSPPRQVIPFVVGLLKVICRRLFGGTA